MAKVGFGGGCHWCTEGVFQALRGVTQVEQGFLQSAAPADTWAEGVIVTFEPSVIGLETLSEVHAAETGKPVHTLVLPFAGFKASDERYQNYYRTDPNRPFCRRYIDPKLDFIRKHFSENALER